ncbi:hypothetical protein ACMFMF_011906 [Clarireedia jacksonii]
MLNDTGSTSGALVTESGRDGNGERGLVRFNTDGGRGEGIVGEELLNDSVCCCVNDGDVGDTGVRSSDVEFEWDDLSSGVGLEKALVVFPLVTLAQPDPALGGIVVALGFGNLKHTLDVSIVVGSLVNLDLLTTGSGHGGTRLTWGRRDDGTVSSNGADEASGRKEDSCSVLHFD